jgi:hypothetical protein
VISQRIFLRLLQASLALLLLAGAPAGGALAAQDCAAVGSIEARAKAVSLGKQGVSKRGYSDDHERRSAALTTYLDVDDEKDQHAQSAVRIRPAAAWCAALAPRTVRYRAAPATHRSCAAPPTGPPHA